MKFETISSRCKGSSDSRKFKRVANHVRKVIQNGHSNFKVLVLNNGSDVVAMKKLQRLSFNAARNYSLT